MPLTRITTNEIKDLSITNADIAENANISDTKLSVISSTGKVSNSATSGTNAAVANTLVLRDTQGGFSATTINLDLLTTKNIINTISISSPSALLNEIIVQGSGFWNSTVLNVSNALITNANINAATILNLTIEEINAQLINVENIVVGAFGGSLITEGTENIVRFSFANLAGFPATADYSGTLAFAEDTEKLYLADGEEWVQISTYNNPIENSPNWKKFTVAFDDFTDVANSQSVTLSVIPAKTLINGIIIKHSTAFSGGTSTAYTLSVGTVADPNKFTSNFDVFQATGDTVFLYATNSAFESFGTWNLVVTATSVGDTLNNVTAGSAEIWTLTSTLI